MTATTVLRSALAGSALAAGLLLSTPAVAPADTHHCQIFRPTPHWLVEYAKCELGPLTAEQAARAR